MSTYPPCLLPWMKNTCIFTVTWQWTNQILGHKCQLTVYSRKCFFRPTIMFQSKSLRFLKNALSQHAIHARFFRPMLWDQSQFTMRFWNLPWDFESNQGDFSGGFFAVKYQHFNLNMQTVTILVCYFNVLFGLKVLYWRKDNKADIKNCFICNLFPLKVKTCDQF